MFAEKSAGTPLFCFMTKVTVIGFKPLQKKFNGFSQLTSRELETGLDNMVGEIVPAVKGYTPVWKGTLRDAIEGQVEKDDDILRATIKAWDVEEVVTASVAGGTRPHWPPWGPGSNLDRWSKDHGIPTFLVARAIATKGTIKRFGRPKGGAKMFDKGLADSMGFIQAEVVRIGLRVIKSF